MKTLYWGGFWLFLYRGRGSNTVGLAMLSRVLCGAGEDIPIICQGVSVRRPYIAKTVYYTKR
jgi:hypothetical protein